jgi:hypothetical protein
METDKYTKIVSSIPKSPLSLEVVYDNNKNTQNDEIDTIIATAIQKGDLYSPMPGYVARL